MDSNDKAAILAQGIANARKVMQKVESNTSYRGVNDSHISREMYADDAPEREPEYLSEEQVKNRVKSTGSMPANGMKNLHTSKMPKEILQSFMENPIVDPTMPIGLDSVVEQVAKVQPKKVIEEYQAPASKNIQQTGSLNMDTQLIEYIIKKTVEETLEQVSKQTAIDETFQIKIGDKVFGGKLTVLKENKTSKK